MASAKPSESASTAPVQVVSEEELAKRAKEVQEKAWNDGERLRTLFWQNLASASSEPAKLVPDEEKKLLANGLKLSTVDETTTQLKKAKELFAEKKFDEAETLLTQSISLAALDETLLGELYQIRGKIHYEKKNYMLAIRDLSMAKNLFFEAEGETIFYRMRCYIDLGLPNYATLDYDHVAEHNPDFPTLKTFKSKVTGPLPHDFQKLMKLLESGKKLPLNTSLVDLVKITIVIALVQDFGFEELGKFIFMMKMSGYSALLTPASFGAYLRDVFAATDMEDISEVFTHYIPEHEIPVECNIHEVVDAVQVMGEGCHLIHKIGFAMCFSLAWTPTSMWNLHATLFFDHIQAKFALQRALWQEYFADEMERISRQDDDVSYFANGGIGEIPPPHARIDYLYATDHGASDYVRLHAVATAHLRTPASTPADDTETRNLPQLVVTELQKHVPLNTFHVTLAPMIFAAARDAMPHAIEFMIQRGAEVNIMDAAEETPLDAARISLEFRIDMLHDHGQMVPVDEFQLVEKILKEAGTKSTANEKSDGFRQFMREAFEDDDEDGPSFHFGGDDEEDEEEDIEDIYNHFGDEDDDDEEDEEDESMWPSRLETSSGNFISLCQSGRSNTSTIDKVCDDMTESSAIWRFECRNAPLVYNKLRPNEISIFINFCDRR